MRQLAAATALITATSLLVAGVSGTAQADPEPATGSSSPLLTTFPRPEDPDAPLRTAIEEAKKQGKPVAVEAAYTEASRTWAYPDGHLTLQSYAGPTQLKQADGSWAWIDTTLVEKDGVLKPKLAKADVQFSLGGDGPFASLERDKGQRFALSWLKDLPRPDIRGNVATYVDAAGPGADLVVTALPDGFRHDVVLRERPSKPVEIRIPVETDKLTFSKAKNGMLRLSDNSGTVVAQAHAPVMTEASASSPPANSADPAAQAQSAAEISTRVEETGKGKSTLVLTPDPEWLADPATQYPVVVDPTTTLTLQSNLYLYYYCGNSSTMSGDELWAGSSLSSCPATQRVSHMRTYLDFDTTALAGRSVASAQLELYARRLNNGCSHIGTLKVSRLISDWKTGSGPIPVYDWANKPNVAEAGSQLQVCPAYNQFPRAMVWQIKDIANAWATGATDYGLQIRGENETQAESGFTPGWVSFDSSYTPGGYPPKLTVSYMLPPEIPTVTAESIDSLDGTDAIARAQNVKVGFKSSVAEGTDLNYTVTVNESTMVPPPMAPTGHVAHWKFDEATGASTAADASGNGYTATYSGSRRKNVTGKLGSAIELNDMTGSNGCCFPDSYAVTSRPVLNQNSSFSISTWVKLKNSDAIQYVASQDGDPYGLSIYYLNTLQKWRLQVSGTGGATGYGVWIDTTQPVRTDAWSHLVAMYDASAGKIRLYVDGALSAEADYQPSGSVASGPFRIGSRKGDFGSQFLQGSVDDMRVYQRALSAKEVKDLYGEVSATSYNSKPSGQVIEQTFPLHNPASLKFVVKACRSGVTPPSCNESPAYRITSDAPMLPTDTETGMADPAQPILSGMVNRPSGGSVSAKYYLYDNNGTPVGSAPLGVRTVNGGERASFQVPANTVQPGTAYTWQMSACVGEVSTAPDPDPDPTPTPTPTPSPELKARWSFDEATGTTAADSSGNNHSATLTGATWGTGKSQSGLQLSGSTSSYGVTNGPVINTNSSYTVSAWARIDNITADHAIVSQDGAVNSAFKLAYSPGDKKWRMVTYQTDTTNATPLRALSTQNAIANEWTHLVGVYDSTAGKMRLYVNGVLNAETTFNSSWNATSKVQIGRTKANGTLTNFLKGAIDEVRLYQKALTAEEISNLYSNPAQTASSSDGSGSTQEVINGAEVCTAKTAPLSFTTPGTPPPPPTEDVRHLTLGKDSFVIKTAKTDPTACDGAPCIVTDSVTMHIGGAGTEKSATVIGFKLDELPDGALIKTSLLKLGTPRCLSGTCPADSVITATPLKDAVTNDSQGSELATGADTSTSPYSFPLSGPQADIGDSTFQWLMLTSNTEETVTFADPADAEQPSLAVTYVPAGPPSNVLNLITVPGDGAATASWGLPVSNGSLAMLDNYDVEIADSSGSTIKSIAVQDPYAVITGLANGETYSVKVRAKTAFGASGWETASVTPEAVPPPPQPTSGQQQPCIPFLDTPPAEARDAQATGEAGEEYIKRVKNYYQSQDAVLDGSATTVWDAPGVSASAPSTAKLSLLNSPLVQTREAITRGGDVRSNSSTVIDDAVVQQGPDETIRVIAKVTRTWTLTPTSTHPAKIAQASGQVEPIESTISIHVFDRCGNMTEIQAPNPAYEDSTDHMDLDDAGGCTARAGAAAIVASGCGSGPAPCTYVCLYVSNRNYKVKGLQLAVVGESAWKPGKSAIDPTPLTRWNLSKLRAWTKLYYTTAFERDNKKVLDNLKITLSSKACFKQIGLGVSITHSPLPVDVHFTQSSNCGEFKIDGGRGKRALEIPTPTLAYGECGACVMTWFRHTVAATMQLSYKDPDFPDKPVDAAAETKWTDPWGVKDN
ncbi:LamG-like jellyroll fold domain-containing protein [Nonomuraea aridisoli]|uniref:Fibronectin type-III domain-containing protein n=1 Tax=Nonomuraea aridisoli TaxID=2070368 RepID=A0A2W2EK66_9ACTN|nr:LamG-like jellyroll fold domain-containing protein [Nonomuraea aridisoli]PZG17135.1 hypothetical protein C1J01_19025 [Nonomuraea aridisoli]